MSPKAAGSRLIECFGVEKRFPSPEGGEPVTVLRGVRLVIAEKESIAILGPSGAGKSTLLSIIGTLEPPSAGTVLFRGAPLSGLPPRRIAAIRSREVGFVFQGHFLLPQLTVLENVLLPAMTAAGGTGKAGKKARALLERVGLSERLQHRPGELSGGECQRAALARALINSPAVVFADEPTGSLDSQSAELLTRLLIEANRDLGIALVIVTHSEELASRMERTVRMKDGVIVETGA
jgi:lipoprotein-releasing system ATP-binding protein